MPSAVQTYGCASEPLVVCCNRNEDVSHRRPSTSTSTAAADHKHDSIVSIATEHERMR